MNFRAKFECNLHSNFTSKFTFEFECKFTFEFESVLNFPGNIALMVSIQQLSKKFEFLDKTFLMKFDKKHKEIDFRSIQSCYFFSAAPNGAARVQNALFSHEKSSSNSNVNFECKIYIRIRR